MARRSGRPLTALWRVNWKVPFGGGPGSARHSNLKAPLIVGNDSVCALPRPDQEPIGRHCTTRRGGDCRCDRPSYQETTATLMRIPTASALHVIDGPVIFLYRGPRLTSV